MTPKYLKIGTVIQGTSSQLYVVDFADSYDQMCQKCVFVHKVIDENGIEYHCNTHKCVKELGKRCDELTNSYKYFRLFKGGL